MHFQKSSLQLVAEITSPLDDLRQLATILDCKVGQLLDQRFRTIGKILLASVNGFGVH